MPEHLPSVARDRTQRSLSLSPASSPFLSSARQPPPASAGPQGSSVLMVLCSYPSLRSRPAVTSSTVSDAGASAGTRSARWGRA